MVRAGAGVFADPPVALIASRRSARVAGVLAAAACVAAGPVAYVFTTPAAPVRQVTVAPVQPGIVHDRQIRVDASQRITTSLANRHLPERPGLIV
ncbi:MAG: hypothetical protein ACM3ML_29875 [Micromonosporaceae bacterium]